jgi:hypothetical protein
MKAKRFNEFVLESHKKLKYAVSTKEALILFGQSTEIVDRFLQTKDWIWVDVDSPYFEGIEKMVNHENMVNQTWASDKGPNTIMLSYKVRGEIPVFLFIVEPDEDASDLDREIFAVRKEDLDYFKDPTDWALSDW